MRPVLKVPGLVLSLSRHHTQQVLLGLAVLRSGRAFLMQTSTMPTTTGTVTRTATGNTAAL